MPRCGATFDESSVPLGQRGTSGGFERRNKPTSALHALAQWFDPSLTKTAHQPPRRGRWPRHSRLG